MTFTFYEYLWFFIIYAFLGWCLEVVFHAVTKGEFVNRGFLYGPVCPIYGFGVVIILYCLTPLKDNVLYLFVGSVILTTLLEWVTGFLLKKLFNTRWWDYTEEPFNIGGYVCLRFSLMWGVACLLVVDILHPLIARFVGIVPTTIGWVILAIVLAYFAADTAVTVANILKFNRNLEQLEEMANQIHELSEAIGVRLATSTLEEMQKNEERKENITKGLARIKEESEQSKEHLAQELARLKAENDARTQQVEEEIAHLKEENAVRVKRLEELAAQRAALIREKSRLRMLRAFPNMKQYGHEETMKELREEQGKTSKKNKREEQKQEAKKED